MKTITNPDPIFVKTHKKKLKNNNGFCPGEMDRSPMTKCPCCAFREQETPGYCGCGYYCKVEDDVDESI